jgi:hypothetical protein
MRISVWTLARFGDILPAEPTGVKFSFREESQVKEEFMLNKRASKIPDFGGIETWVTGVRKWLLLYRPVGIDSFIVHPLFYFCALSALALKVRGIIALHDSSPWLALMYFTSGGLFGSLTFYLRRVSQKRKAVGMVAERQNRRQNP